MINFLIYISVQGSKGEEFIDKIQYLSVDCQSELMRIIQNEGERITDDVDDVESPKKNDDDDRSEDFVLKLQKQLQDLLNDNVI